MKVSSPTVDHDHDAVPCLREGGCWVLGEEPSEVLSTGGEERSDLLCVAAPDFTRWLKSALELM